MRLAEVDLADDYAYHRLSEAETRAFREKYLLAAHRRNQLSVSQRLRERFAGRSSDTAAPIRQRLAHTFDVRRPVWRYVFAAVILIVVLATVVKVTKELRLAGNRISPVIFRHEPQPTATPQEMHHPTAPSSQTHVEEAPTAQAHESPVVVALDARGEAPVITPSTNAGAIVRFHCPVKYRDALYASELIMNNGETRFRNDALKSAGSEPAIDWDIPANVLASGDFEIRLTRVDDQSKPEAVRFNFRVP